LIAEYSKKIDFIVTDHHSIELKKGKSVIPNKAEAVVHPGLENSKYPFSQITGTTIAWKLVKVVEKESVIQKNIDNKSNKYLDLVALATVCDVMPLIDENRTLVKLGLQKIHDSPNIGLNELIKAAKLD